MEQQDRKQSLKQKWSNFLSVILDPWVLSLFLLTVVLCIYLAKFSDDEAVSRDIIAVLTIIISLVSGLLGGVIANKWAQMTEMKVLVARGLSAIRSLKLILLNVSNIEKRIKRYIETTNKENVECKLIVSNYEEVIEKCNIVEEEIISSIENWTDIIPEVANLKTQIGLVTEMKINQLNLETDISKLKEQLQSTKEQELRYKKELSDKLSEKETELVKTKMKLREKESQINTSVLSGLTSSPFAIGTSFSPPVILSREIANKCVSCGKTFFQAGISFQDKCDDCRGGRVVLTSKDK